MKNYTINLQRVANLLIIFTVFIYGLIVAKSILVPLVVAVLFAFILKPLCDWVGKRIAWEATAIFISFLIALVPILALITLFSWQFHDIYQELPSISKKLQGGFNEVFSWVNNQIRFTSQSGEKWFQDNISSIMDAPINFIGDSISSSAGFLVSLTLTGIYTFLLLLYRSAFKKFFLMQFSDRLEGQVQQLMEEIHTLAQSYLYGLLLVILLLGVLNSFGLWFIGIEYALFWGFLAAFLAIIPYIGTFTGGLLVVVYSFATTGTFWQPMAVVGLFALVQFLEGNLITPKIVGESVKINPLAAIISLVIGGTIWGMAGLVLTLPIIAISKKVMVQIDVLRPFGLLLSSELYEKDVLFEEKFNKEKFRLWNFLKKKKEHD